MRTLVSVAFIVVGVIHLLPLSGALGNKQLETLYGLSFTDPNLSILMRHRAVLFGLLGLFFLLAAFQPQYQPAAFVAGFVSVLSFLWLALAVGGYSAQIARVFRADIIALACLIVGVAAYIYEQSKQI